MNETQYRSQLEETIRKILPDCFIMRNDAKNIQGIPDIIVMYGPWWAMLEIKVSEDAPVQPNQPYYIDLFDRMGGFSAFIWPENETDVLTAMVDYFNAWN